MRYCKELSERFIGDETRAVLYTGTARKLLGMLDNQMTKSGIQQNHRTHKLADGTIITVSNIFGQRKITIDVTKTEVEWVPLRGFVGVPTAVSVTGGTGSSYVPTSSFSYTDTITSMVGSTVGFSTYPQYSAVNTTYVDGIDYGQITFLDGDNIWALPGSMEHGYAYSMNRNSAYQVPWYVLKNGEPWSFAPYSNAYIYGLSIYDNYVYVVVRNISSSEYEVWRKTEFSAAASWALMGSFSETGIYIDTRFSASPSGQYFAAVYDMYRSCLEITISDSDGTASFGVIYPPSVTTQDTYTHSIEASGNAGFSNSSGQSGWVAPGIGTNVAGYEQGTSNINYSYTDIYDEATLLIAVDYDLSNNKLYLTGSYSYVRSKKYEYSESLSYAWSFNSGCTTPRNGDMNRTAHIAVGENSDMLTESRLLTLADGSTFQMSGKSRTFSLTSTVNSSTNVSFSYPTDFTATYPPWTSIACGSETLGDTVYWSKEYMVNRLPELLRDINYSDPTPEWVEYTLLSADLREGIYFFGRTTYSIPYDSPAWVYSAALINYRKKELVMLKDGALEVVATAGATHDLEYGKIDADSRDAYFNFQSEYPTYWNTSPDGMSSWGSYSTSDEVTRGNMMWLITKNAGDFQFSCATVRDRDDRLMVTMGGVLSGPDGADDGAGGICRIDTTDVAPAYGYAVDSFYIDKMSRV